jgi:hypothetical protein
MDRADIPYISATGLSHLLRKKEVSAVEAVEAIPGAYRGPG